MLAWARGHHQRFKKRPQSRALGRHAGYHPSSPSSWPQTTRSQGSPLFPPALQHCLKDLATPGVLPKGTPMPPHLHKASQCAQRQVPKLQEAFFSPKKKVSKWLTSFLLVPNNLDAVKNTCLRLGIWNYSGHLQISASANRGKARCS